MTDDNHTEIIAAYISRLNVYQLNVLRQAQVKCLEAALNGNAGTQLDAHVQLKIELADMVSGLLVHDKTTINYVVKKNAK